MIGLNKEYRVAIEHFGEEDQIVKLQEEIDELKVAINELGQCTNTVTEVEKELADVINVAMQFVIHCGGSAENVMSQCAAKMHRTMKRIDSGYYD